MFDADPAAVVTAGTNPFGMATSVPTGFTPQIGDGPLSPSLFDLDARCENVATHDFHPEVRVAPVASVPRCEHLVDVASLPGTSHLISLHDSSHA